jgi:hypothetical protein
MSAFKVERRAVFNQNEAFAHMQWSAASAPQCKGGVMNRVLLVLLLALLPASVMAADYRSSFGFSFSLSDDWLVLTPGEVSSKFEAPTSKSLRMEGVDQKTLEATIAKIKDGKVEYYFYRKHAENGGANDISAQLAPGDGIPTPDAAKEACAGLKDDLAKLYGEPVQMKSCVLMNANGIPYMGFEYLLQRSDITIIQREIPYLRGTKLVLAGATNSAALDAVRLAEDGIAASATKYAAAQVAAQPVPVAAVDIPAEAQLAVLQRDAMHAFALSVNAKDFSGFHKYISRLWQGQISVAQLNAAFKPFMDAGLNLLPLDKIKPVFSVTAPTREKPMLVLTGYYPTRPLKVDFIFGYVYEKPDWKLIKTEINVKPVK